MENDKNKLLHDLGAVETEKGNGYRENHIFSDRYNDRKQQLIEETRKKQSEKAHSTEQTPWRNKKWFTAAAAGLLILLGSGTTVYAGSEILEYFDQRNEMTGTYSLQYKVEEGMTIPLIDFQFKYIPEGFVLTGEGEKNLLKGPNGESISISQGNPMQDSQVPFVSEVQDVSINGKSAKLQIREGMEFDKRLTIISQFDGQIVDVYASSTVSTEELIKVAEGLSWSEVEGTVLTNSDSVVSFSETTEDSLDSYPTFKNKDIIEVGDVMNIPTKAYASALSQPSDPVYGTKMIDGSMDLIVNDIVLYDVLPDMDNTYFTQFEEYEAELNSDGTLIPEQFVVKTWNENKMKTTVTKIPLKFVAVSVTMKNTTDQAIYDVMFDMKLSYNEKALLKYEIIRPPVTAGGSYEGRPLYFAGSSNPETKHSYFMDFELGEAKEFKVVFPVDETQLQNAWLVISKIFGPVDSDSNYGNYAVKIKGDKQEWGIKTEESEHLPWLQK
jgi:hypothetical protein